MTDTKKPATSHRPPRSSAPKEPVRSTREKLEESLNVSLKLTEELLSSNFSNNNEFNTVKNAYDNLKIAQSGLFGSH